MAPKPFLPLAFLLALLTGTTAAAPKLAIFRDDWTPDPYKGLAVADGDLVDEQEVYLWLMIGGQDPLVVRDRQNPTAGASTARQVERAVYDLLETTIISQMPEAAEYDPAIDPKKAARILAAPAAYHAFAERRVRPAVQVMPADIALYYRENMAKYGEPETVVVRRLLVPYANPSIDAQQAALVRAAELRAEAVRRGGLQALLDENAALLVDAPGTTFAIRKERDDAPEEVERLAFSLAVSQIGPPLAQPGGALLLEVLDRKTPVAVPVEKVSREIHDVLFPPRYEQQFDVRMAELLRDSYARNRTDYFHLLEGNMEYLGVRDFSLTKDEFLALRPEFRSVTTRRVPKLMRLAAEDILQGQAVVQYGSAATSDFYLDALELAERRILAEFAQRHVRETLKPTEQEVREYLELHRDEVAPRYDRSVWLLSSAPRGLKSMPIAERDAVQQAMVGHHRTIAAESSRLLRDRASVSGPAAYGLPELVVARVAKETAADIDFTLVAQGTFTAREAADGLDLDFEALRPGDFSSPRMLADGTVAMYYVGEEIAREELPDAVLMELAGKAYVESLLRTRARQRLNDMEAEGRLRWKF